MGAPLTVIAAATLDFLRRYAPFSRMHDSVLQFAIERLELAYFAQGEVILAPQHGDVAALHVVHRGIVGVRAADPRGDVEPALGPGEVFPVGALSAGTVASRIYHAAEDTFCFLLPRPAFMELRARSPEFELFCTQAITETLKQSLAQMQGEYSQLAAEQQTLAQPLHALMRRTPVTCAATAPVREALATMRDGRVRTIVVVNAEEAPVGIFTLIDLLERVVLPECPLDTPIAKVMSAPVVQLPADAPAEQAMQLLAERHVRQLVLMAAGKVAGLVSERDLFALQRVSMRQVGERLRGASSRDHLQRAAQDIRALTQNLLAQGAGAEALTRTIASLNDALTRKVVELVLARHNLADSDWCWLALGSEGRGEQTFATDQDNAVVFAPASAVAREVERARLLAFAHDVNVELDAIGFPLCSGDVMAGNPEMCLTIDEWQARFLGWIRAPTPEALLNANILFDFRALYGDSTQVDALRGWLGGYTQENRIFLRLMVQNALETEPPLGLVRTFATDDDSAHKGTIDLKVRGTRIFVDVARVFALAYALPETGTAARLRIAGARLNVEQRHVDATIAAFHFLQLLRLRQQYVPGMHGSANRIDPYALNEIDQRMLKEAFRQARSLQRRLRDAYQL